MGACVGVVRNVAGKKRGPIRCLPVVRSTEPATRATTAPTGLACTSRMNRHEISEMNMVGDRFYFYNHWWFGG